MSTVKACPRCGLIRRVYKCQHDGVQHAPVDMPEAVARRLRELTGTKSVLHGKPRSSAPTPQEFNRSFAQVGVLSERGSLIELRAPDPDNKSGTWPRIWLTAEALRALIDDGWLAQALEYAEAK